MSAKHPIRACWFMTTLHHPTGATASAEKKRGLVRLLTDHGIPLIEDDAYAELQFGAAPSPPAKMTICFIAPIPLRSL